ncbi:MAG: tetratricopeptide repeat protein [Pedobacter sp.]|nr:MAG: tetratricopeptide repeat protein [Pedobacter sp.]
MQNNRLLRLLEFLDNDPNEPFILYALATEYNSMGDTENALKYYENLITYHSTYVGTYYHYAKLLDKLGRREDAIGVYKSGMEVAQNKGDRHALSELKAAYFEIAEDEEEENY